MIKSYTSNSNDRLYYSYHASSSKVTIYSSYCDSSSTLCHSCHYTFCYSSYSIIIWSPCYCWISSVSWIDSSHQSSCLSDIKCQCSLIKCNRLNWDWVNSQYACISKVTIYSSHYDCGSTYRNCSYNAVCYSSYSIVIRNPSHILVSCVSRSNSRGKSYSLFHLKSSLYLIQSNASYRTWSYSHFASSSETTIYSSNGNNSGTYRYCGNNAIRYSCYSLVARCPSYIVISSFCWVYSSCQCISILYDNSYGCSIKCYASYSYRLTWASNGQCFLSRNLCNILLFWQCYDSNTLITRTYDVTRIIPVHLTNLTNTVINSVLECQYWLVTFPYNIKYLEVLSTIIEDQCCLISRNYIATCVRASNNLFIEVRSCWHLLFTIVRIELERSSRSIALTVLAYLAYEETVASTPNITLGVSLTSQGVNCWRSSFPLAKNSTILLTNIVNSYTILRQCTLGILIVNEEFNLVTVMVNIATRSRRTSVNTIVIECTIALACTSKELVEVLGQVSCVSYIDTWVTISPICYVEVTIAVDRHTGWVAEFSDAALVLFCVEFVVSIVILPYTAVYSCWWRRRTRTVHYVDITKLVRLWVSVNCIEETRCARCNEALILWDNTKVSNSITLEFYSPCQYLTWFAWKISFCYSNGVSTLHSTNCYFTCHITALVIEYQVCSFCVCSCLKAKYIVVTILYDIEFVCHDRCNYRLSYANGSKAIDFAINEQVKVEISTFHLSSSGSISSFYWSCKSGVSCLNLNSFAETIGNIQHLHTNYLTVSIGSRSCHEGFASILEVCSTIVLHIQHICWDCINWFYVITLTWRKFELNRINLTSIHYKVLLVLTRRKW